MFWCCFGDVAGRADPTLERSPVIVAESTPGAVDATVIKQVPNNSKTNWRPNPLCLGAPIAGRDRGGGAETDRRWTVSSIWFGLSVDSEFH